MDEDELLKATQQLSALNANYWHDIDTNWGRNAGKFYTEDAVFAGETASYHGRKKIEQFYQWRVDRGPRLAVHAITNFRVEPHSSTRATCTWYLHLYAADGEAPLPTNPPINLGLVTDLCVKGGDGKWRYASRTFKTLFEGGAPATNPNLDDD